MIKFLDNKILLIAGALAFSLGSTSSGLAGGKSFKAYLTGYSYWDNTPPGSSAIARPVIHKRAGGTGTYRNPITIAVGHSIIGGISKMDYPKGTRFYIKRLRKYAIVEDLCGDGPKPQKGPCHTGKYGKPWLDIYVGGAKSRKSASESCMNKITGMHTIIRNPGSKFPVSKGPLTESGCKVF
ncbi:MAG: hypothetical protein V3V02_11730 [Rhizobiaceae bacterium]